MNVTLLTLVAYGAALIGIGLWAARRSAATADYLLGGRRLGPVVAALSASASSSSAWTLLGVSGAAYVWGLSALWLLPATLGGFVLNWYVVAPRLQRLSHETGALTLTEIIAPPELGDARPRVLRLAATLVLVAFLFYIASQFEGAAKAFSSALGYSREAGIFVGAGIVMFYTLLGGFWAASVSDALQGLTMVVAAIVLPLAGLVAVGGPVALWQALPATWSAAEASLAGGLPLLASLFFVLGTLGIGLGYPGQPHVVNRFMALRDAAALRQGRRVAVGWAVVIYTGMLLVGFSARVLFPAIGDSEQALFQLADRLLPAVVAAVLVAAVLSAIMSTADSQLLVAAASLSHDWRLSESTALGAAHASRSVVLLLSVAAAALALYLPQDVFSRVLFAWHALGSAFGPVLLLRLGGYMVRARPLTAALASGFGLTVVFHLLPNTPGDVLERLAPFAVAALLAWTGRQRITR